MNKIRFNEGGQPVYLDDLQLLQENQVETVETLLGCLCNGQSVLLTGGGITDVTETEGGYDVKVSAGKAFVNGDIVEWEDLDVEVGSMDSLFLCMNKTEEDLRDFENGAQHYCREKTAVVLSTTKDGATGYIDLYNPKTFANVLKGVLGLGGAASWDYVSLPEEYIYAGFSFSLRFLMSGDYLQIKLKMSSTESSWGSNGNRVLFYWYDTVLAYSLKGKYSPVIFVGNDGKVYSDIIEWCTDTNECRLLDSDGNAVAHIPSGKLEGFFNIYL